MQSRKLKKILGNPGYIVHETRDYICVGSHLCHDLISVRKSDLQLRYALDTFHKGKKSIGDLKLETIWEKLEELINTGEIQEIIHGEDIIENSLPVFSYDENYKIITSATDEYGWPNTDIKGCLMYNNMWFLTRKEALDKAIHDCESEIKSFTESIQEKRLKLATCEEKKDKLSNILVFLKGGDNTRAPTTKQEVKDE